MQALLGELEQQLAALEQKLALALFELDTTQRKLFGRSADNLATTDPNQIPLFDLGTTPEEIAASDVLTQQEVKEAGKADGKEKVAVRKKQKTARMELPVDLPRQEVVIHPE